MYPAITDLPEYRDQFRSSVAALAPGELRDVLTAVAYARDGAARTGGSTPSDDRWRAVITAAERAITTAAAPEVVPVVLRLVA
jgi:hypothetical protein